MPNCVKQQCINVRQCFSFPDIFTGFLKKIIIVSGDRVHVFSCYAPTFAASREEKDSFYNVLHDALSTVPVHEPYILLVDFNACVGSSSIDDQWWYERGPLGYGELNEAGEELLSFLATNGATACNTWLPMGLQHVLPGLRKKK